MTNHRKIKVLVVEDSNVVRTSIVRLLNSDPGVQVIGTARNGREALQFLSQRRPDVIVMDIEMPEMGGLEATRRIMETEPVPVIIYSDATNFETITPAELLETGAVACVEMPAGRHHKDFDAAWAHLLHTVKLMSEIKVVHRWPRSRRGAAGTTTIPSWPAIGEPSKVTLIGIGASTGGPPVLKTILDGLPKDFPVPLLVVQHIAKGFLHGLVDWLNRTAGGEIQIAADGTLPLPGHVYFAPDDHHMAIAADGRIALTQDEPDNGLRPSVACLFRSLAEFCGPTAVGVLLTGMGKDGARELKTMKDRGATTIVQDRQTSVVHGMPGQAIAIGAATCVLPCDRIAPALIALSHQQSLCEGVLS
jgi:two-component system chemotaxis response regulator CheB